MIQLTNYINDCSYAAPGNIRLLIADYQDLREHLQYEIGSYSLITGITTGIQWFDFQVHKPFVEWNEGQTVDPISRSFTTNISLYWSKIEASKRDTIDELLRGNHLVILQDTQNKYWLLGIEGGMKSSTYTAGAQLATNGYSMALTNTHRYINKELSKEYIESILPSEECWDWCQSINSMDAVYIFELDCILSDLNDPCI